MDKERFETSEMSFETREMGDDAGSVMQRAADNPMLMLLGGLAVGFLIGMLVPVSRFEHEQLGPVADDLKGRVREAGAHAARRGGEMIKESIDAATESMTAPSSGGAEY
jgi:hypothetical protein